MPAPPAILSFEVGSRARTGRGVTHTRPAERWTLLGDEVVDVAVVGGGPAGSAAAIEAARLGASVTLFERSGTDRPKPCGDALTQGALDELEALGLSVEKLISLGGAAFESVSLQSGGEQVYATSSAQGGYGWVVPRSHLDQALRDLAAAAGATVSYHAAVRNIEVEDAAWSLDVRAGSSRHRARAQTVVLAHGAASKLSTEHDVSGNPGWSMSTTWYESGDHDQLIVDVDESFHPGYAWSFPTGKGMANRGICALDRASSSHLRELAASWMNHRSQQRGGAAPVWSGSGIRWHDERGLLACGDAAGLVDPVTSEGIRQALESGRRAGRAVARWVRDGSEDELQSYSDWVLTTYRERFQPTPERVMFQMLFGLL